MERIIEVKPSDCREHASIKTGDCAECALCNDEDNDDNNPVIDSNGDNIIPIIQNEGDTKTLPLSKDLTAHQHQTIPVDNSDNREIDVRTCTEDQAPSVETSDYLADQEDKYRDVTVSVCEQENEEETCSENMNKPEACVFCGRVFKEAVEFKIHLQLHLDENNEEKVEESKTIFCSYCGMAFTDPEKFITHLDAHKNILDTLQRKADESNSNVSEKLKEEKPALCTLRAVSLADMTSCEAETTQNYSHIPAGPDEMMCNDMDSTNIIEIKPSDYDIHAGQFICDENFDKQLLTQVNKDAAQNYGDEKIVLCTVRELYSNEENKKYCVLTLADDYDYILKQEAMRNKLLHGHTSSNEDSAQQEKLVTLYNLHTSYTPDGLYEYSLVRNSVSFENPQSRAMHKKACCLCYMKLYTDEHGMELHMYRHHLLEYMEAKINDEMSKTAKFEKRKIIQVLESSEMLESKEIQKCVNNDHTYALVPVDLGVVHLQKQASGFTDVNPEESRPDHGYFRKTLYKSGRKTVKQANAIKSPLEFCSTQKIKVEPNCQIDGNEVTSQREVKYSKSQDCAESIEDIAETVPGKPATFDHCYASAPFTECATCKKTLISAEIVQHMTTHERKTKTYTCEVCSKSFKTSALLKEHSRHHSKANWFNCEQCDEKFKYRSHLLQHMSANHNSEKPHECELCGERFFHKLLLNYHIRKHKRPHTCEECKKTFQSKCALICHERVHSGEKPYQCDHCGKCFSQKSGLDQHVNCNHRAHRFKCDECGKRFATKQVLTIHKRTHTGELPCVCTYCNKAFRYYSSLKLHLTLHTGIRKKYKCKLCPSKEWNSYTGLRYHQIRTHHFAKKSSNRYNKIHI